MLPEWTTRDSGRDALRLAEASGIDLIPWQEASVVDICAERAAFDAQLQWAATAAGLIVPRQNGKGGVLETIALAGVVLFGEQRILWTAHQDKTVEDAHARMEEIFDSSPALRKRLAPGRTNGVLHGKGSRAIKLRNGAEIQFFTRSPSAGRGLWADRLFLDEALDITDGELRILRFTLRTSAIRTGRRAQVVYASTPPDKEVHANGIVLARLRQRALAGKAKGVAWVEHSVPSREELGLRPNDPDPRLTDESFWIASNPSLGYLFDLGVLQGDKDELDDSGFLLEGLAAPDFWPDPNEQSQLPDAIDQGVWRAQRDASSRCLDPVALGIEVSPSRDAALVVCGWRADGRMHGEVVAEGPGTGWVIDVLLRIVEKTDPFVLVIDKAGQAGSLVPSIEAAGLEPLVLNTTQRTSADRGLVDDLEQGEMVVVPSPGLDGAAAVATWRDVGDVQAFDRRGGRGDIKSLVGLSLARFGLLTAPPPKPPPQSPRVFSDDQLALVGAGAGVGDIATMSF